MLKEIEVKQIAGESPRRWFENSDMDLIIWQNKEREIIGFQLCYAKRTSEKALTWNKDNGYSHQAIDDGESHPMHFKRSPVLVQDGKFEAQKIADEFAAKSGYIERDIAEFVVNHLLNYKLPIKL